jgi:hypothetical protein
MYVCMYVSDISCPHIAAAPLDAVGEDKLASQHLLVADLHILRENYPQTKVLKHVCMYVRIYVYMCVCTYVHRWVNSVRNSTTYVLNIGHH